MTNFSRRQVLSLPMAASVVGAGAAGAAYAADSNSKVNAPDFDAIEDRMTLLTKRGASLSIRQKHLAVLSVAAGLGFEDLGALRQPHSPMDWRPATLRRRSFMLLPMPAWRELEQCWPAFMLP